jgi:3-phenylpropionate/trans-cinnamate dioxygenase ferredoxin subunit
MAEFVKVASTSELAPGEARQVTARGKEIALFNIDGEFFALDNACTHDDGPLAEGEISGSEIVCPFHGARFDIRTGEVLCPPAFDAVARYDVRVTGTDIEVEV